MSFIDAGGTFYNGSSQGGNSITGGAGGDGGNAPGGTAGKGGDGGDGVWFSGGDGTLVNYGGIAGGMGGNGGTGSNGGNGGNGGNGVVFEGVAPLTNYGTIAGGSGGTGVIGGVGGTGVWLGAVGASTLTNYGSIAGGNGGAGTTTNGAGGAGVRGADLTIVQGLHGTISGGAAGGAGAQAGYAIDFAWGANVLSFQRTTDGLTGRINLGNGASLTLDQRTVPGAGSVTIGNAISESVIGTGSVTVDAGTNAVTLTAVNTYTGPTTVYSGTLQIGDTTHTGSAASIMSDVTVNSGATLRGTGTIYPPSQSTVIVNGGGTLWPGATGETSGHMLTVDGHVQFVELHGNVQIHRLRQLHRRCVLRHPERS